MIRVSLWTAAFLVLLRVCIGWHFFFEGVTKVRSAYQGGAAAEKEKKKIEGYFRESEGPFGRLVQKQSGDPDQYVIDRLTPKPADGDGNPAVRFPAALEPEWDDYFNRFASQFKLDDDRRAVAKVKFDEAKASYVNWLNGLSDEKDPETKQPKPVRLVVKRKAPPGSPAGEFEEEVTVPERIAELKRKTAAVREAYDQKLPLLGADVEGPNLVAMKADAAAVRADLQKEIDAQTTKMKDALKKELGTRVTAYEVPSKPADVATALPAMLTPMADGKNPLAAQWDSYAGFVKDVSPGITAEQQAQVDEGLKQAKQRFDRWLADQDPYTGTALADKPLATLRAALAEAEARAKAAKEDAAATGKSWQGRATAGALAVVARDAAGEADTIRGQLLAQVKGQTEAMKSLVGAPLLGGDRAKGYAAPVEERWLGVVPKDWKMIDYLDWSTRWFLSAVGVLLMVGLFTRFSCFAAAGFLLLTYLTHMPLPWLPTPPNQEGTYLFVNKNIIEMVALLALMTTRSGKWAGLDGLVGWAFGRTRR
ncbi:MAG TPA: DoxX family protein [Gemmataceae bacterium]|jgi:uncharacterized membrane protein YphA (DoxX/SURF4 family)|nr:DoxX family protein [Gemmataceae bacterium]